MTEPVSLDQIIVHLRLDPDDHSEDDYLISTIVAARRSCEKYLNRSVVGETRTATFDGFPQYPLPSGGTLPTLDQLSIALTGGAVLSIQSISYFDGTDQVQTIDPSQFGLSSVYAPALLTPIAPWPMAFSRPDAVTVTYTVSPLTGDDLALVVQAILLLVGHWYRNRESVSIDVRGVPAEMPHSITWLLSSIRVIPF